MSVESNETVNNQQKQKPYEGKSEEQTLDIGDLLIEDALLLAVYCLQDDISVLIAIDECVGDNALIENPMEDRGIEVRLN